MKPIIASHRSRWVIGTGTQNWQRYGTGAINVDACRVSGGVSVQLPESNGERAGPITAYSAGYPARRSEGRRNRSKAPRLRR